METITRSRVHWTIFCAYVGGLLLAVVPALVELASDEFFVLLPVALLLALAVIRRLGGGPAHRAFVAVFCLAVLAELGEQFFFPDQVPTWADVAPPVLFTLSGVALLAAAREASSSQR